MVMVRKGVMWRGRERKWLGAGKGGVVNSAKHFCAGAAAAMVARSRYGSVWLLISAKKACQSEYTNSKTSFSMTAAYSATIESLKSHKTSENYGVV
ncbi:hypothetical protein Droror1_Dr00025753 [Drosera rotundifolia]